MPSPFELPTAKARATEHEADMDRDDAALVAFEAGWPGLALLLDACQFRQWLQRQRPAAMIEGVRPLYLRYKHGTSCLASFMATIDGESTHVYATAYRSSSSGKWRKATRICASRNDAESDLAADGRLGVVARFFPNDAELTSLAALSADPDAALARWRPQSLPGGPLRIRALRYKPQRRFVGEVLSGSSSAAVFKLYARHDYLRARLNAKVLASLSNVSVPQRIGHSHRDCGLLFEWLPGVGLGSLLAVREASRDVLESVGAALATLHLQHCSKLLATPTLGGGEELLAAAGAIGDVRPQLGERAVRLAQRLAAQLEAAAGPPRVCHGDFYADQVLVGRQVALVDLDDAGQGDACRDLGNFIAHLERKAVYGEIDAASADAVGAAVMVGYHSVQPKVDSSRIACHTAGGLLRLAIEPFRRRERRWADATETLLNRAESIADASEVGARTAFALRPGRVGRATTTVAPRTTPYDDPHLPSLREALQLHSAQQVLPPALAATVSPHAELTVAAIRVLRHKPGRRCLVEYELVDQRAPDRRLAILGKTQRRPAAHRDYVVARAIYDAGFEVSARDGVSVPEPLAAVDDWNMWLQRKVEGSGAAGPLAGDHRITVAVLIAEAIYKLHDRGPAPPRTHSLADEMRILRERLSALGVRQVRWRRRIERLLAKCESLASSMSANRHVPIHRDFYADQVLLQESRVTICDLDLYAWGDPAVDVGNFAAHLVEQGLREHGDARALADAVEAFVTHYRILAPHVCPEAIEGFQTLSLARLIELSTRLRGRDALAEPLLALCEERLR